MNYIDTYKKWINNPYLPMLVEEGIYLKHFALAKWWVGE